MKRTSPTLKNKIALITGSSRGIGLAVAERFAREGATVILNSAHHPRQGMAAAARICKNGGTAFYLKADVTKMAAVKRLFRQIDRQFGRIDILVNNAGFTEEQPLKKFTPAHWDKMFAINLMSTVMCCAEAIRRMEKQGSGHIINTASIRGLDSGGRTDTIAYNAAKAAVINVTKNLAKQGAPDIFVNVVVPGFVATEDFVTAVRPQQLRDWTAQVPIKRFIEPSELADVHYLLATSRIFTGSVLVADGGYMLHRQER